MEDCSTIQQWVRSLAVFWQKVKHPQHGKFSIASFSTKHCSPKIPGSKYLEVILDWAVKVVNLTRHKHWTEACLSGHALKWKMSIKTFPVWKWMSYHGKRCWFIPLSSLSNRHISCSDSRLECACCFADELWLSGKAYLSELFTSGVLNAGLQKRLKTVLLTLWQNRHNK